MDLGTRSIGKDFISKYFVILMGVISISLYYFFNNSNIVLYYGILLNIIIIIRVKNSRVLQIVFLFMLTYLLNLVPYFSYGIHISYYSLYQKEKIFESVLIIHVIFLILLYAFMKKDVNSNKEALINKVAMKDNGLVYASAIGVMSLILLLGKTGHNLSKTVSQTSQVTDGFAINEYFLIFTFIAYVFTGNLRSRKAIILILSALYIVKNTLAEGRIETLQLLILLFILFIDTKKINNALFWFGSIAGYLTMSLFEKLRISSNGLINLFKTGQDGSPYIESNQGDVFYNSAVYVGLIKDQIFNYHFRINSFIGFVERIFLPSKYATSQANVSIFSKAYAQSGGGGLISIYFYVWLSYLGIVLIALILAFLVNKLYKTNNQYAVIYFVMFICTVPRWFAYDPITLFKLSSYAIVIFFCFNQLDIVLNKNKKKLTPYVQNQRKIIINQELR
ncbi:hypothetical protein ACFPYJ_28070 [Paenibacillus solisilvae]|uniref:O-antigen polysaccharide polymerase Wzy n=1 Tax=Paenibacillus solisilvae TaxID=2486751 RepID=A0ABW0W5X9_9BACL